MKQVLFVVAILINGLVANAQTIGLKLGTEVELPTYLHSELLYSPTAGIYFEQPIIGRLGISIGADYQYSNIQTPANTMMWSCCWGCINDGTVTSESQIKKHSFHIPMNLYFDFIGTRNKKWYATVYAGLDMNTSLLAKQTTFLSYDETTNYTEIINEESGLLTNRRLEGLNMPVKAGLEISHTCKSKFVSTLGLSVGKNPYRETFYSVGQPHKIDYTSLYLKTGLNLKKKR